MALKKYPWFCDCCSLIGIAYLDEESTRDQIVKGIQKDHLDISNACENDCVHSFNLEAVLKSSGLADWIAEPMANLLLEVPEDPRKPLDFIPI